MSEGGNMSRSYTRSFKLVSKLVNWVKDNLVAYWIVKALLALIVGIITYVIAQAAFKDLPVSLLCAIGVIYIYLGHQIINHATIRMNFVFSWLSLFLIFISLVAAVIGFILLSNLFGWICILISTYSIIYLLLKLISDLDEYAQEINE